MTKKGGQEGAEQEMPQPPERPPVTVRNALFAVLVGKVFTRDERRGRE